MPVLLTRRWKILPPLSDYFTRLQTEDEYRILL